METKKKNLLLMAMDTISACMTPVVPVLLGCGLIKLLVLIVGMTGVSAFLGDTETLLTYVDSAPFYFLPMLLAYSASVHFGCNTPYALASVAVMLYPDFVSMMEAGRTATFLGIPVLSASYSYTVIPVIVLIYVMKHIQTLAERYAHPAVKSMFVPMLTIMLTGVLGIVAIGPMMSLLSGAITEGMGFLQNNYPVIAWMVMCAVLPLLIMTGTHFIFVSIMLEQLGSAGVESGFHVSCFILYLMLTGACLVVFLKSHGEVRKTALSTGMTLFTTGVSEPAMFGICLPLRTPLIAIMISGAIAGIWQGLNALHSYVFSTPSIFSVLIFYSADEPNNLPGVLIAGAIGFVVSVIVTALIYREKPQKQE